MNQPSPTIRLAPRPTAADIIEIRRNRPMVSSLKVAELFERNHRDVLRAIRKELSAEISLRKLAQSEETNARGKAIPVFWLTEEQALVVMPFIGGRMAREGQRKLVRAYLWYRDNYANPPRRDLIAAKRAAHHPMMGALIEMREEAGKETDARHFQCENKLVNWVVTGEFKAIDEATLSNDQAELLRLVRERNAAFLLAGIDYPERKKRLLDYAMRQRTRIMAAEAQR
ncbi:Rha family transcriptional regulator [Thiocapsa bogorovii]|uniref:Rha family transcriptional regulator n=1 Tax=Thiocapsa bogorovii TaxID=521689 RepID=UPI001E3E481B|nr:Rha family transcriptional regulator [Thiocapsa bogorovii]UHD18570.1 Rha family transcriptional regulator [Thiocapsa bogorovii]